MTGFPMDPRAYAWIPPRMAVKIRRTLPLLGALSTVAALAIGTAALVMGYSLPISHNAANGIGVMLGVFCAVFLLISGVTLLFAPAWVETGHHASGTGYILRLRPAYLSAGPLCAGSCSLLTFPFFYFFSTGSLTWSAPGPDGSIPITSGILVYLLLPLVAFALGVVDLLVGWPLLRPSPRTIHRYQR
jgi:hypothetical protein